MCERELQAQSRKVLDRREKRSSKNINGWGEGSEEKTWETRCTSKKLSVLGGKLENHVSGRGNRITGTWYSKRGYQKKDGNPEVPRSLKEDKGVPPPKGN